MNAMMSSLARLRRTYIPDEYHFTGVSTKPPTPENSTIRTNFAWIPRRRISSIEPMRWIDSRPRACTPSRSLRRRAVRGQAAARSNDGRLSRGRHERPLNSKKGSTGRCGRLDSVNQRLWNASAERPAAPDRREPRRRVNMAVMASSLQERFSCSKAGRAFPDSGRCR